MCGLIVTNRKVSETEVVKANFFNQRRGPDMTTIVEEYNFTFIHNLLSITGAFTKQPFVDSKNGIVALFNGEIYNYRDFGPFVSDGESLISLYKKYGWDFVRKLDGEFALVVFDFKKNELLISSDVFATKPLWFAIDKKSIGIASYKSSLECLGFKNLEKVPPNTMRVYRLSDLSLILEQSIFEFSLEQNKGTLDDFFAAFESAVEKRTRDLREKVFIGLSSGHDSGALALAMTRLGVYFEAYSINGEENPEILRARHTLLRYPPHQVHLSYAAFLKARRYIKKYAEPHRLEINPKHKLRDIRDDSGAIGLSHICSLARSDGAKIYLSGQGADEIISDYGMCGKKLAPHSTFAGIFPEDLVGHFPWYNFYGGAQKDYLAKEEHVSGAYGIEGRYPFLDKFFVQEFLSLTPELKNKSYKYPLAEYMRKYNYPFDPTFKKGFVLGRYSFFERIHRRMIFFFARFSKL